MQRSTIKPQFTVVPLTEIVNVCADDEGAVRIAVEDCVMFFETRLVNVNAGEPPVAEKVIPVPPAQHRTTSMSPFATVTDAVLGVALWAHKSP